MQMKRIVDFLSKIRVGKIDTGGWWLGIKFALSPCRGSKKVVRKIVIDRDGENNKKDDA